ncbi:Putative signal peptide peptidase SppA [Hydrogenovibrio crunogenus]|uniref:Signal peptide peptidase SppA n=1 Tax=Hydrogenovibrio crunogenus TaxID=39765 RepID=A0A4V1C938_9GAMM|nr:signal peptide peptidase SppA [Hydrogenovibrio crunogenus]QBZ84054.1 Putative signal peptide peptidase SppA [Hydrogenovibrio crunogenus]
MIKKTLIAISVASVLSGCATIKLGPSYNEPLTEQRLIETPNADAKVLMIPVEGTISNEEGNGLLSKSPGLLDRVSMQLRKAEKDASIRTILLRINSPGGGVTTSDILYHELLAFKQRTGKKIFVQMMDVGASGAYYISMAADTIQVHPTTLTGSVGVITVVPNVVGLSEKIGVEVKTYKTGANKDTGSPFRRMTKQDDAYLQSIIDGMATRFYDIVQTHRGLSDAQMQSVKTARVYLGKDAVKAGLADSVGYLSDARSKACELGGAKRCDLVTYRFEPNVNANMYSPSMENPSTSPDMSLVKTKLLSPVMNLKPGSYYLYLE